MKFEHKAPGDSLAIPASDYNGAMDAAMAASRRGPAPTSGTIPPLSAVSQQLVVECWVPIDTVQGSIVEVGGYDTGGLRYPPTPETLGTFKRRVYLHATAPTGPEIANVGVCVQSNEANRPTFVSVAGPVQCKINMMHSTHRWAKPVADETAHLVSDHWGTHYILGVSNTHQFGGGVDWGVVMPMAFPTPIIYGTIGQPGASYADESINITRDDGLGIVSDVRWDRHGDDTMFLDPGSQVSITRAWGFDYWRLLTWECV